MKTALGFLFFILSLYYVIQALKNNKKIMECGGCRITATIVDNKMQIINGGICIYYPVYSYMIDGEMHTFQSQTPSSAALQLGMQIPIYYNHKTRTPVEATAAMTYVVLAMVFVIVSVLFLNAR